MSKETEQVAEAVDHRAEVGRLLGLAEGAACNRDTETYAAQAQVHASLAIAEELGRLNKTIASVIGVGVTASASLGSGQRFVRTSR